ncbi:MAG: LapA family protein [bacterium]
MLKLFLLLIVLLFIIIFATENLEIVKVSFLIGEPIEIPLFFVMVSSLIAGFILAIFANMYLHIRRYREKTSRKNSENEIHF